MASYDPATLGQNINSGAAGTNIPSQSGYTYADLERLFPGFDAKVLGHILSNHDRPYSMNELQHQSVGDLSSAQQQQWQSLLSDLGGFNRTGGGAPVPMYSASNPGRQQNSWSTPFGLNNPSTMMGMIQNALGGLPMSGQENNLGGGMYSMFSPQSMYGGMGSMGSKSGPSMGGMGSLYGMGGMGGYPSVYGMYGNPYTQYSTAPYMTYGGNPFLVQPSYGGGGYGMGGGGKGGPGMASGGGGSPSPGGAGSPGSYGTLGTSGGNTGIPPTTVPTGPEFAQFGGNYWKWLQSPQGQAAVNKFAGAAADPNARGGNVYVDTGRPAPPGAAGDWDPLGKGQTGYGVGVPPPYYGAVASKTQPPPPPPRQNPAGINPQGFQGGNAY